MTARLWRVAWGALLGLLTGALLLPATTAWARGRVVASDPVDGAALARQPVRVALTCSQAPDPDRSHVSVRDAAGALLDGDARPRVAGTVLSLPVRLAGTGNYTIVYHVVFVDGDEVTGSVRFSVGTGVPPPAQPAGAAPDAGHDHGVDPVGGVLLVADVAVLVAVLLLLFATRPGARRAPPAPDA